MPMWLSGLLPDALHLIHLFGGTSESSIRTSARHYRQLNITPETQRSLGQAGFPMSWHALSTYTDQQRAN